jgi:hypothetical protein
MSEFFIFPGAEIEKLWLENQIDILKELREQGLSVERAFTSDPAKDRISQSRDITLVIIASGITAIALSQAISKIIETLSRRPVLVKNLVCAPVLDSAGNIVRQENGEVLMEWKEEYKLLEPTQPSKENQALKVDLLKGLQFELLNEQEK